MLRTSFSIGKHVAKGLDLSRFTIKHGVQFSHFVSNSTKLSKITAQSSAVYLQRRFFSSVSDKVNLMNATKEKHDDYESSTNMAIRPKLRVSDVLETMQVKNFTISQSASVLDALSHLIDQSLASSLVVNSENEILGIFTARDILKCIQRHHASSDSRTRRDNFLAETKIKELMTTRNHLVYCSPSDSARRCREIMFQCKIRNLPVIDNGEVRGIITAKNLADASFNIIDTGGKKGFIHNVTGRRGLPEGTRINQEAIGSRHSRSSPQQNMLLDMEVASFALPHPFKRPEGVAMSRRLYGADELSTDMELCEDAHFALKVVDPLTLPSNAVLASPDVLSAAESAENVRIKDESRKVIGWGAPEVLEVGSTEVVSPTQSTSSSHIYLCVADGVGSWRQYGVDPRAYSHRYVVFVVLHIYAVVTMLLFILNIKLFSHMGFQDI